jgi:two-component system LytT family response regulator
MLRNTMANFETKLDPDVFLRIHRSAIVNLQHVKEFRTDGNDGECFVIMSDGHKLSVSRGYRSRITSLIAR